MPKHFSLLKKKTKSEPEPEVKGKKKAIEVVETKKKNTKRSEIEASDSMEATLQKIYSKRVDQMEKRYSITSQELHIPNKVSTGLLCPDTLMGGGIAAGIMYQVSGKEKGAKTTLGLKTFGQMVTKEVPVLLDWDAENAQSDPVYAKAAMGHDPKDVFYGPNKKARLYQESVLEDFYNSTKFIMRSLPDKIYRQEHNQWYFVFDSDKEGRIQLGDFGFGNKDYDAQLLRDTGRLWVPTDLKGMQGFVLCDSYPALVTKQMDEEEEGKTLPALDARAFSANIKKVVGVMKQKGFSILGINQIRTNPMPMYGALPEYEPGGNALAFYSSVRLQNRPRSCPNEWFPGVKNDGGKTTQFGQEPSVYGKGYDRYNYINMINTKNKLARPGLACVQRIWFSDGLGNPHGYDVAFDTFEYLKMTGRINGSPKNGFKVDHPAISNIKWTWDEFKLFILAHTDPILMKRARAKFENMKTITDIRKDFFKEIRTRKVYEMIVDKDSKVSTEDLEA